MKGNETTEYAEELPSTLKLNNLRGHRAKESNLS